MSILISGFEKFSDLEHNPTEDFARFLSSEKIFNSIVLPVSYKNSFKILKKEIDHLSPDLIIAFGVSHKTNCILLERQAKNLINSKISDNEGELIQEKKIILGAPESIETSLKLDTYEGEFEISLDAGSYVCNFLYFNLLSFRRNSLFIHVPLSFNRSDYDDVIELIKKIYSHSIKTGVS